MLKKNRGMPLSGDALISLCWPCCQKVIAIIGIPKGSSANTMQSSRCWQCGDEQDEDDAYLAQWVPMHQILKYEIALAVAEAPQG